MLFHKLVSICFLSSSPCGSLLGQCIAVLRSRRSSPVEIGQPRWNGILAFCRTGIRDIAQLQPGLPDVLRGSPNPRSLLLRASFFLRRLRAAWNETHTHTHTGPHLSSVRAAICSSPYRKKMELFLEQKLDFCISAVSLHPEMKS